MKQFCYLVFILFCANTIFAQKYKLIESKHFSDNSRDCRKIGDCISSTYLKNGTLYITFYINNQYRVLDSDGYSIDVKKGVLSINTYDLNSRSIKDTIIQGVKMHRGIVSIRYSQPARGGYDTQRYEFKLSGFRKVPGVIQFNHTNLCNCPIKPVQFEIYKKYTINMINSNGKKQGLWLKFFSNGKIQEEKYYDNGTLIRGKTFDENGKDLHYVSETSGSITSVKTDSLFNK